jgi:hypothetical protein
MFAAKPMKRVVAKAAGRGCGWGYRYDATPQNGAHLTLTGVVEGTYTTATFARGSLGMAFVRKIGNAFYLVHNVRRAGKVKQLHLAPLGERPRITDEVVRSVSRNFPFLKLNWSRLREKVNDRVELFEAGAHYLQKLSQSILSLNLDLADLAPPLLALQGHAPHANRDVISQLRLLRSTLEVKLDQFDRVRTHGLAPDRRFR